MLLKRFNGNSPMRNWYMVNNGNCFFFPIFAFYAILLTGCSITEHPRLRPGSYASSTVKVHFLDPNSLGMHNYDSFSGESDGIAYTCRGGHIDLAHLRIAADNIYYLYHKFSRHLQSRDTEFTYKLNADPSIFAFHVTYPPDFMTHSTVTQQEMIDELSLELAQYGTWYMVTWHEVLTWFGLKVCYVVPQFQSAFSWEDSYSNLLGTILGAEAIHHPGGDFNVAMTLVIRDELKKLGVQSSDFAYYASERVRGKWFKGNVNTIILLRNLDIGSDDGFVSPSLVPDVCIPARPMSYPVPNLNTATQYGFKVELEIKPHSGATNRCRDIIYPDGNYGPILPAVHLPIIMKTIRQQAIEKGFLVTP